jgi:WhiB family redox-sensing transcriptional regulator
MTVRVNWEEVAACRDADPDLFFPVGTAGPALRQVEAAKRICRACPVQALCLAWALDHGADSGVRGGYTEAERRVLRRAAERNQRSARMTAAPVNDQARENMAYVRRLLRRSKPRFAAVMLADRDLPGPAGDLRIGRSK